MYQKSQIQVQLECDFDLDIWHCRWMSLPLGILSISFFTESFEKPQVYPTAVQNHFWNFRRKCQMCKTVPRHNFVRCQIECCICMYCSSDFAYFPMLGSCAHLSPERSFTTGAPSPPQGAIGMQLLLHNEKAFEHKACGAASPLCLSKTIRSKFSGISLHL